MNGETLRNILFVNKIELKSLAESLKTSPQSLSQVFKADDVKSGWLERIAAALGKDMSFFYPIAPTYEQNNNNVRAHNIGAVGSGNGTVNESTDGELVTKLLEELSELRKQNQKLMDKLLG